MKIRVIYFAKKNNQEFSETQDEYLKRLRSFTDIEIIKLKPYSIKECNSKEEVMNKEYLELNKVLNNDFLIVLERTGKNISSIEFSKKIKEIQDDSKSITFVIGGAYGVIDSVVEKADFVMSISKLTFTHEMSRVLLLEQIYRAFTIIKGKTYHY